MSDLNQKLEKIFENQIEMKRKMKSEMKKISESIR